MAEKKSEPPQFGLRLYEDRKKIYDRKKVFEKLDTDGDGYVSAHEYDGPRKMFKGLDTDDDGIAQLPTRKGQSIGESSVHIDILKIIARSSKT